MKEQAFMQMEKQLRREKKRRKKLERKLAQAERANRAKSNFLSSISHDIRTPMNAIIGFTMLASTHIEDTEKVLDYHKKIISSSDHLLNLINDVLDISKIESGKMRLHEENCNLEELLKRLWDILQPQFASKELHVQIDIERVSDKDWYCDKLRINQMLLNLFSNAIKFTQRGGMISFSIQQLKSKKEGYALYRFRIRDTGVGMSKEFQKHIFEAFERDKNVAMVQGTGLGMTITKSIVDMMNGSIHVMSQQGKGTEFVIDLDIRLQKIEKEKTLEIDRTFTDLVDISLQLSETDSLLGTFDGKRILLVEDNELNREIEVELLGDAGFCVEEAENGAISVEKVKHSEKGYYDLVLMDVQMPIMNGYQATQMIRELPEKEHSEIPIIAMTANAFETDKSQAIESGMDFYISKPINVEELLETLNIVLNKRR